MTVCSAVGYPSAQFGRGLTGKELLNLLKIQPSPLRLRLRVDAVGVERVSPLPRRYLPPTCTAAGEHHWQHPLPPARIVSGQLGRHRVQLRPVLRHRY